MALAPPWLTLKPPPALSWCAVLWLVSCTLARFRLPPTSATTLSAFTFAPAMLVSPPLTMVAVPRALTCVLFCVEASELASPWALDIDADTPQPPVP